MPLQLKYAVDDIIDKYNDIKKLEHVKIKTINSMIIENNFIKIEFFQFYYFHFLNYFF